MEPLVSIIVPVYNLEKLVGRCLDSVLLQTYAGWECLCVNDGSTDLSGAILDDYARRDSRIRVLHQKNAGVSAARNAGLRAAGGNYVVFVDGDDYVAPDMLYKMVCAKRHSMASGLIASGYWDCDEEGNRIQCHYASKTMEFSPVTQGMTAVHVDQSLPFTWAKMYSNYIIKEQELTFDEDAFMGEDTIFDFKYMMCVHSISYVNDGLYMYCHRSGSCSSNVSSGRICFNRYRMIVNSFLRLYDYIATRDLPLPRVQCYALVLCRVAGACKIIWTASRYLPLLFKARAVLMIAGAVLRALLKSPITLWWGMMHQAVKLHKLRKI